MSIQSDNQDHHAHDGDHQGDSHPEAHANHAMNGNVNAMALSGDAALPHWLRHR